MNKKILVKSLTLAIIILFFGTSVVPLIGGKTVSESNNDFQLIQFSPIQEETILFFDDFNDNSKDYSRWTEVYSDGIWEEKNQRCEFQLYEPGSDQWEEGIESYEFIVPLNPVSPLKINWDFICDIASTNWAGAILLKVTDGTNWILAKYHRYRLATQFKDSNDPSFTYLNENKPYGTYSNEIQIYSDRYIVTMDTESSGPVYDSLFEPGVPLKIHIYIACSGEQPWLFFRSGFDNVKVTFEEPTTKKSLICGKIENVLTAEDFAMFDAVKTRVITFNPFSFNTYTSGETLVTFGSKFGILTNSFVLGFFNIAI
jgi:hypothetical protein